MQRPPRAGRGPSGRLVYNRVNPVPEEGHTREEVGAPTAGPPGPGGHAVCQAVADKRGAAVPLQGQQEGQGAPGPALYPTPAQNTTPATHRTCLCPWPCQCAAPLSALFPTFARNSGLRCRPHFLNFLRPQAGPAWCIPLPFFFFF